MRAAQVVEELVSNVTVIEKLQSFQHKDKNGKDWGLNVRQRAKELTNLVLDGERIRGERAKVQSETSIMVRQCEPGKGLSNKAIIMSGMSAL